MVQLRGGARFPDEAIERFTIVEQVLRNELQRDVAAQAGIFRVVDHSHAATAELSDDVVVGDSLADHGGSRDFHRL